MAILETQLFLGKLASHAIVMEDHVIVKPDNVWLVKAILKVLYDSELYKLINTIKHCLGFKCERCKPGYFGNPTTANCQPCLCDHLGSLSKECNNVTGQCLCKERFTGLTCDKCEVSKINLIIVVKLNCNLSYL